jgi:hypothetical protein
MWTCTSWSRPFNVSAGTIALAQKFTRAQLIAWVQKQIAAGHEVHTVYEACGFGYTLHHALGTAGAHSIVTTPMRLSPERRRKNDRLDARELCVRPGAASRWAPARVETHSHSQPRGTRAPGAGTAARVLEARAAPAGESTGGRCASSLSMRPCPRAGRGPRKWKQLSAPCSPFVREQLEPVGAQIRACKEQMERLTDQIESLVACEQIPKGLGALTVSLLEGEVCQWQRFQHAKPWAVTPVVAPANTVRAACNALATSTGMATSMSEFSLVEAVWRLLRYQPAWHARQKYLQKFKAGASLKKKMAVALARQLAIDLWRWRTGRCTAAELGWTLKSAAAETRAE